MPRPQGEDRADDRGGAVRRRAPRPRRSSRRSIPRRWSRTCRSPRRTPSSPGAHRAGPIAERPVERARRHRLRPGRHERAAAREHEALPDLTGREGRPGDVRRVEARGVVRVALTRPRRLPVRRRERRRQVFAAEVTVFPKASATRTWNAERARPSRSPSPARRRARADSGRRAHVDARRARDRAGDRVRRGDAVARRGDERHAVQERVTPASPATNG